MSCLWALFYGLLLILAARNFWAAPSRVGVVVGTLVVAALLAAAGFCLWASLDARKSWGPEYVEVHAGPGTHVVRISPVWKAPGFSVRLVRKAARDAEPDFPRDALLACEWTLAGLSEQVHHHTRECGCALNDSLFDVWTDAKTADLGYVVSAETRPMLEEAVIEVTCPWSYRNHIAMISGFAELAIVFLVSGAILGICGVISQALRLKRAGSTTPSSDPRSQATS